MTMLSYAQNAEDVLLWRVFSDVDPAVGFYIDIGANHPVHDSVTKHFSERGWRGVNAEPVVEHADRLRADRPRDVNLNVAVGAEPGTLTFHQVLDNDGLSTFDPAFADSYRAQGMQVVSSEVPVVTLAQVFDEHAPGTVHFLKIDVEGHERAVISGADWQRHRPMVVVIEATKPEEWDHLLLENGYDRVLDDGINYVYVAREHAALGERLLRPVTVCDQFVPHEWTRRVDAVQRMFNRFGGPGVAADLLGACKRRPSRGERAAAEQLAELFTRREDLIRLFAPEAEIDHDALLTWAIEVPVEADGDIGSIVDVRPALRSLRDGLRARRQRFA